MRIDKPLTQTFHKATSLLQKKTPNLHFTPGFASSLSLSSQSAISGSDTPSLMLMVWAKMINIRMTPITQFRLLTLSSLQPLTGSFRDWHSLCPFPFVAFSQDIFLTKPTEGYSWQLLAFCGAHALFSLALSTPTQSSSFSDSASEYSNQPSTPVLILLFQICLLHLIEQLRIPFLILESILEAHLLLCPLF